MIYIYMYMEKEDERGKQRNIYYYIAVNEKLRKDVLDAKGVKGIFKRSNHYVVLAKIKIKD